MRVTIVNLFYPPDVAPSGYIAESLAEHRTIMGDHVTVVHGTGAYVRPPSGPRSGRGGRPRRTSGTMRIVRVWTPSLGKESTARRLADYVAFLVGASMRLISMPRQDVVVALTSPPFAVICAVAHRLVHPRTRVIVWSQDLYPDAAEEYGTIDRRGFTSRALRAMNRWLFRWTDHLVALDHAMLDRVLSQYATGGRPLGTVVPNWESRALFPGGARPCVWGGYDEHGLAGRFVVLYLGNLGYGHPTGTIAAAAAALSGDDVAFLFVGGGVRYPELEAEADRLGLRNVVMHGYVPKEVTPRVLAGAGCTLISLDDGSLGIMSPCKLHPSLAMGVPVVYVGPRGTNVDEAIAAYGCGISVRQGDAEGLAKAILDLRRDPDRAAELSRNARRAFDESYCDEMGLPRFDAVLEQVARPGGASTGEPS